ncbi:MAG: hypothetical protein GTN62_13170 [Gemmatimonadales bacterium]|nr:hypothetical protein [Gemmatimonadales bacterium]NIN12860.1 hypothetical protein [Gemmatimonadales bacterium]NIN51038.1 hypothetical protein [Gemmatimonadales bacterium]NIP08502.1 hypothetical protein [Gemmatimonadales bacterium]NIR02542.1 hypothetical protein [Gemmatimonadales bacterium]
MRWLPVLLSLCVAVPLAGQEQEPPEQTEAEEAGARWLRLGLFGFAARAGADFEDEGQVVVSFALDVGDLYTERVRIRPSGEIGVLGGDNTYVANLELLYRLMPDTAVAVPYIGVGVALAGREDCALYPDCPAVWAQFAVGFELRFRERFSWLLEYHPEDALRRHRLFVGLTTRRGS